MERRGVVTKDNVVKGNVILYVALVLGLGVIVYLISVTSSLSKQHNQDLMNINSLSAQINQSKLEINGKADVFDAKFHDLLQEHTFLLINTVRRSLDSSASYNASLAALQNNINEIGALLTPIYGANAQQLVNLWNTKTNVFLNYSNALKNNDPAASDAYAAAAASYEENGAQFWVDTNNPYPIFDKATMKQLITNHMNDVKFAVDDWNAKNYPAYFSDLENAYIQIGTYADTVAQGIIQQNPKNFI